MLVTAKSLTVAAEYQQNDAAVGSHTVNSTCALTYNCESFHSGKLACSVNGKYTVVHTPYILLYMYVFAQNIKACVTIH